MENNAVQKKYFQAFYNGNRLLFLAAAFLEMAGGFGQIGASVLLGAVTDCMATGDQRGLVRCAMVTAVALPVIMGLMWVACRCQTRVNRKAMTQYKALAYAGISAKGISAFTRENTGRYLSALTNDVSTIEKQYLPNLLCILQQSIGFVLAIGVMLYYSWSLTLIMLTSCALPLVIVLGMSGRYAGLTKKVSEENEHYTGCIKDLLSGFSVIKSFQAEKETNTIFADASDAVERRVEHSKRFEGLMQALSSTTSILSQLGTFIIGAFMALRGDISAGTVLMFVNLCNSVLNPIQTIPTCWAGIRSARGLIRKLAALSQENTQRTGTKALQSFEECITVQGMCFGYEPDHLILKDIDMRLEKGKKYAIVGASGSGKSTLLNLLMGADDRYTGSIAFDGQELKETDPNSLYGFVSLIGQNVFLFDTTIRQNITMFRPFSARSVQNAIARAGLTEVLRAKGEEYRCGENGIGLSGGERQRISIARCLLRDTPILLLDEATAALDNQTAFEVSQAILQLEGMTRIVVTHRLDEKLLEQYDEIFVLRDGRITQHGSYRQLMAQKGYFYSLYHIANG